MPTHVDLEPREMALPERFGVLLRGQNGILGALGDKEFGWGMVWDLSSCRSLGVVVLNGMTGFINPGGEKPSNAASVLLSDSTGISDAVSSAMYTAVIKNRCKEHLNLSYLFARFLWKECGWRRKFGGKLRKFLICGVLGARLGLSNSRLYLQAPL